MLYHLARRYDEFEGEEDAGSSLRGAFKGWFHHGVALEEEWPALEMEAEPDLEDPTFRQRSRERPLGAFYRVNPYRLDDMQSALNELQVIVVSSIIHDGWVKPVVMEKNGVKMQVIARRANSGSLGGHAFALVGYNELGFLVQNSWGPEWGKGGFATLPYEDWLDLAYDAWVARPGVPKTPFSSGRNRAAAATGGTLATAPGPDLQRLAVHVVNLGNNGRLSQTGKFVSTPAQIDRIFTHMKTWHDWWLEQEPKGKRHVVLYAHGGLVSEADGMATAQKHVNWWLNNRIYPLSFAWQSGPVETLVDQLTDLTRGRLPFGGIGFDLVEQFDRLVEKIARTSVRWMWDEMKENARAASRPIPADAPVQWPPVASTETAMSALPGASLAVTRLAHYVQEHGAGNVAVHLVGHSAGSIFHAALLERLRAANLAVESLTLLAPAIRVDEWAREVLPHLQGGSGGKKTVERFATFAMTDERELDDTVGTDNVTPYHKSLLYLVARAFERPQNGQGSEVPLLGMEKFFDRPVEEGSRATLGETIKKLRDGAAIFSRSDAPGNARSDAHAHGDFDDDAPTMTSVVMRMLNVQKASSVESYRNNAALRAEVCPPAERFRVGNAARAVAQSAAVAASGAADAGALATARASSSPAGRDAAKRAPEGEPLLMASIAHAPGQERVVETAEPQTEQPVAPEPVVPEARALGEASSVVSPEVAVAPRSGSSVIDLLESTGWKADTDALRNAGGGNGSGNKNGADDALPGKTKPARTGSGRDASAGAFTRQPAPSRKKGARKK